MYILDYGNNSTDFRTKSEAYRVISRERSKFIKTSKSNDLILILMCEDSIDHIDSTALAMANIDGEVVDFTSDVSPDSYDDAMGYLKYFADEYRRDSNKSEDSTFGEYRNVKWSFKSGHLFISGSGDIISKWDANLEKYPWESLRLKTYVITIGEGITSIPLYAFDSFKNLSVINLPTTLVSVGRDILPSPNNVTINVKDFDKLINIKTDKFSFYAKNISVDGNIINDYTPDLVDDTFIMPKIFNGTSFNRVVVPDGTIAIGDEAFSCNNAKNILLPNSIKHIGKEAFEFCSISRIEIPDGVISIGNKAFYHCEYLTNVNIPNSVTSIGDSAFSSCENLTSITIGDSVTSISDWTFWGCTKLQFVEIQSNDLQFVGDNAFTRCTSLKSIQVNCTDNQLIDVLTRSGWSKPKIKNFWYKFKFNSSEDLVDESYNLSNMPKMYNKYYIDFTTVGEICNQENADYSTAKDYANDAIEDAVSDLANEVVSAINAIVPEANAKTKVEDDQSQSDDVGSITMLVYISKSVSRETALKGIANAINCVGIGSATFTSYDYENGVTVRADDYTPACYAGWKEYPEIEASVDVQLTITDWEELDDNGEPINN